MSSATVAREAPCSLAKGEQRLVLHGVAWEDYEKIGDALHDRPGLRLTYDRGELEIMTTSPAHEMMKKRLSRLIETLAEEFGLEAESAGNMTFKNMFVERGLEADDCFWIAHEAQVRGKMDHDPDRDPPPDLALEIEFSRSAVDRMGIYAKLRVPQVWRFDGETIRVEVLHPDGQYRKAEESPTFPGIPLQELARFAYPDPEVSYLEMIRRFRIWVREQLAKKN